MNSTAAAPSRDVIFGRIREALRAPARTHHPLDSNPRPWAPLVPDTLEGQIRMFAENAQSLKADFRPCADSQEAARIIREFGWKKMGAHDGEMVRAVARELKTPAVNTSGGYAVADLESCDGGLTECEALIAQTGSVLISSASSGGRALSILPPHHVVLARRSQMTGTLADAFRLVRQKYNNNWPSLLSFISGPSRTGDIERILVLGAHGPKKLTILLLP